MGIVNSNVDYRKPKCYRMRFSDLFKMHFFINLRQTCVYSFLRRTNYSGFTFGLVMD